MRRQALLLLYASREPITGCRFTYMTVNGQEVISEARRATMLRALIQPVGPLTPRAELEWAPHSILRQHNPFRSLLRFNHRILCLIRAHEKFGTTPPRSLAGMFQRPIFTFCGRKCHPHAFIQSVLNLFKLGQATR